MTPSTLLLAMITLFVLCFTALGGEIYISNTDDLINFSNNVSGGKTYSGTTVFLEADIDFTGRELAPIGTESNCFTGTFDGQGHTISNLVMKYSDKVYVGLFGYSTGMTVKNVVMDSSCSIENSYTLTLSSTYLGGIVGECEAIDSSCVVENCVSMASVAFSGSVSSYAVGGGIYGRFDSSCTKCKHDIITRNCANYGTIAQIGKCTITYLGGLCGECLGTNGHRCITENCLNAGSVVFDGTVLSGGYVGGLGGSMYNGVLENCASIGKISTKQGITTVYSGALLGNAAYSFSATNCVWTSDADTGSVGRKASLSSASIDTVSNSPSTLNTRTLDLLNNHSSVNNWNMWLLNTQNHTVEFSVNGNVNMRIDTSLVIQPDIKESEGKLFRGWHTDALCTAPQDTYTITEATRLYSVYGVLHSVVFAVNDTTHIATEQAEGSVLVCPEGINITGHTFVGWNSSGLTTVPNHNVTIQAVFFANNYTLTFDYNNGSMPGKVIVAYGDTIPYPTNLIREGYRFYVWNCTIERMPANDITITAQWKKASSFSSSSNQETTYGEEDATYVEIVFGKKDMSREEVEEIIKKYTNESVTIAKVGEDSESNTLVIIKFNDHAKAMNFVEAIENGSDGILVSINFLSDPLLSRTQALAPIFLLFFVLSLKNMFMY